MKQTYLDKVFTKIKKTSKESGAYNATYRNISKDKLHKIIDRKDLITAHIIKIKENKFFVLARVNKRRKK